MKDQGVLPFSHLVAWTVDMRAGAPKAHWIINQTTRPGRHQVQELRIPDGCGVAIVSINSQLLRFFCERNKFLFSLRWDYFLVIFVMIVICCHRLLFNYLPLIIYFKFLYFTCTSYLRFSKTYSQSVVGTPNGLSYISIFRKISFT